MKYTRSSWIQEFPAAITVVDSNGIIIDLNDKAAQTFNKYGGKTLIGKSVFDCHTNDSLEKIKKLLTTKCPNTYSIEKNGVKKLIHQTPWFIDSDYAGFIEFSFEIPFEIPHLIHA